MTVFSIFPVEVVVTVTSFDGHGLQAANIRTSATNPLPLRWLRRTMADDPTDAGVKTYFRKLPESRREHAQHFATAGARLVVAGRTPAHRSRGARPRAGREGRSGLREC